MTSTGRRPTRLSGGGRGFQDQRAKQRNMMEKRCCWESEVLHQLSLISYSIIYRAFYIPGVDNWISFINSIILMDFIDTLHLGSTRQFQQMRFRLSRTVQRYIEHRIDIVYLKVKIEGRLVKDPYKPICTVGTVPSTSQLLYSNFSDFLHRKMTGHCSLAGNPTAWNYGGCIILIKKWTIIFADNLQRHTRHSP